MEIGQNSEGFVASTKRKFLYSFDEERGEVLYYAEQPMGFDSNQNRMVSQWMK
jgi:hypothetical protein